MLLAHVTDIHCCDVTDYPGEPAWGPKVQKHSEALLGRVLADIAAARPDHVVLTGDITLTSRLEEFRRARAHVDAHLKHLRVSALPGNHDVWTSEAVAGDLFGRFFGDLARCDLGRSGFPYVHLVDGVALVALDSSPHVPGVDPARVPGHVAPEQLAALEEIASDPRVRGRFLVVMLHHHLQLSDEDAAAADPKDPTPLSNAAEVRAALGRIPVDLVLHGHRHRAMRLDLPLGDRTVPVLCPGSGSRVHELPGRTARWGLYRIEAGRLAEAKVRAYRPASDDFAWV